MDYLLAEHYEKRPIISGGFPLILIGGFWPILLKKSAMVSAAEKYASDIEIFSFG